LTGKRFFFTIDVDWVPGSKQGLRGLLDLCRELDLEATLFIAGRFARDYPDIVREAALEGYELGTHGWEHGLNSVENFRSACYNKQKEWLELATRTVEEVANQRPVSFRAPNLWISETMLHILEEMGYLYDSSVPARRFDMGFGRINQLRYFHAPLEPYYPSYDHLAMKGSCRILEVPPSAFFVPMNMTALRVLGFRAVTWAVRQIWKRNSLLVFYCHPSEFVPAAHQQLAEDEPARHRKLTGPQNFALLSKFIKFIMGLGYKSARIHEVSR